MSTLRHPAWLLLSLMGVAACDNGGSSNPWRDLGQVPAPASTTLNHTPLVVVDGRAFVGTAEGIWAMPLNGSGEWEQLGLEGVAVFATRRHPTVHATIFAAGQPVDDSQAAPFYRSDDGGATWVPSATWPRNVFDNSTEPFFDLAVAPDDPNRLYANLSGPTIAVSSDGGMTWALANGETEVLFGDPCVIHVPDSDHGTLYQGCEAPLDNAWVGTYDIDPANPFVLSDFTFVAGGFDLALDNRRPNSLASGPARADTVYAGLEGALIALEGSEFDFVFRADVGSEDPPYAYITAIWLDPEDRDHLVFGGGVNGLNRRLSLFETLDHGDTITSLDPPRQLEDPAVEQIVDALDNDLAVLMSESDGGAATERSLSLFVLK